ncbi:MAG: SUF system NifU family Fe-S cluster assembly protein [Myxococcales bacterium]|nr:SUF system NifU family Fe-S cluster assembly protein [Myxococcales bacterium]
MAEASSLYRQLVIEHGRSPRHFGRLESCTCQSTGHNRMCGDKLEVFLRIKEEHVEAASFDGAGCAIMMASASLMLERLQGVSTVDAQALLDCFVFMMKRKKDADEVSPSDDCDERLGSLTYFAEVKAFPTRIKCATLPWEALSAALHQSTEIATTE